MDFRIIAPGANEIEILQRLPEGYQHKILPHSKPASVKAKFGAIVYQHYQGDEFDIWYSNYDIDYKTILIGRADLPLLELHMHIESTATTRWDCMDEKIVRPYQYNLTFTPHMDNKSVFEGEKRYQTFDIHFRKGFLEKYAPYFPPLDRFLGKVDKMTPAILTVEDRFLKPIMLSIIDHIMNCPFNKDISKFYLEAKIIELLIMVLHESLNENPLAPIKLNSYEIERLQEAKELIIKNIESPFTIAELSRKVALNEFKLKKGFKYLFGTTIFDYLQKERMEKARFYLLETDESIIDIAMLTGYNYLPNFNKAFKRHFGYTAAYLRKKHK